LDISLQEAVATFTTMVGVAKYEEDGLITERRGIRHSAVPPGWCYRTADGYVAITAGRPQMWDALAAWIAETTGNTAIQDPLFRGPASARTEHAELLNALIEEFTARFTMAELVEEGQRRH